ncbi:MAG: MvaI/BcnI family restriction endonuclease [Verrucomicrobiota bacterium JB023]|nr:MvaI/BcnI family restriction endonuclease [Verrucomicrobiota bacterium JB023]
MSFESISKLSQAFRDAGAIRLYAKKLSENDNSKNQIYFAGSAEALQMLPSKTIYAENTKKGPSFKAKMDFGWLDFDGVVHPAPNAQLILYAQYPEVRFSGFLQGCCNGPNNLMLDRKRSAQAGKEKQSQMRGRVLFLGVTDDQKVIGFVSAGGSTISKEFDGSDFFQDRLVFFHIPLPDTIDPHQSKDQLRSRLRDIYMKKWIASKQLSGDGSVDPCNAPNCGGLTLEAELGIPKNSDATPDFLGWELKQHRVSNLNRPSSGGAITLMTPEPTGGFYRSDGVEAFVRKFGYPDQQGRQDRLNFGGVHKIGEPQVRTKLSLSLRGFDSAEKKLVDAEGAIELVAQNDEVAASWQFASVLEHWSRKHSNAAYVPSMSRKNIGLEYRYGRFVRFAESTSSILLLTALSEGFVYYDPGIKLENSSTKPRVKRRSQFRIASKNIKQIYHNLEEVDLQIC